MWHLSHVRYYWQTARAESTFASLVLLAFSHHQVVFIKARSPLAAVALFPGTHAPSRRGSALSRDTRSVPGHTLRLRSRSPAHHLWPQYPRMALFDVVLLWMNCCYILATCLALLIASAPSFLPGGVASVRRATTATSLPSTGVSQIPSRTLRERPLSRGGTAHAPSRGWHQASTTCTGRAHRRSTIET